MFTVTSTEISMAVLVIIVRTEANNLFMINFLFFQSKDWLRQYHSVSKLVLPSTFRSSQNGVTWSDSYKEELEKASLLGNSTRAIAKQCTHATREELLEVVCSMWSMPRLHKESVERCQERK
ncbi:hypothetical protein B7P43_G12611 [Cryptotermes secundus]|uniref:Uncharacterized protein n=1 Tax=Cryptotermes secundus TaxID=105785 RepID=A0A2J7QKH7_9NEOP|nr:hypothetical protein B7P43_G12611 [Cryptotermes secundus]